MKIINAYDIDNDAIIPFKGKRLQWTDEFGEEKRGQKCLKLNLTDILKTKHEIMFIKKYAFVQLQHSLCQDKFYVWLIL
jgi:hypothetical protein